MTDDLCPLCEERPTGEQVDACDECADDAVDHAPADVCRYAAQQLERDRWGEQ